MGFNCDPVLFLLIWKTDFIFLNKHSHAASLRNAQRHEDREAELGKEHEEEHHEVEGGVVLECLQQIQLLVTTIKTNHSNYHHRLRSFNVCGTQKSVAASTLFGYPVVPPPARPQEIRMLTANTRMCSSMLTATMW